VNCKSLSRSLIDLNPSFWNDGGAATSLTNSSSSSSCNATGVTKEWEDFKIVHGCDIKTFFFIIKFIFKVSHLTKSVLPLKRMINITQNKTK